MGFVAVVLGVYRVFIRFNWVSLGLQGNPPCHFLSPKVLIEVPNTKQGSS